jgi:hypothetical protein
MIIKSYKDLINSVPGVRQKLYLESTRFKVYAGWGPFSPRISKPHGSQVLLGLIYLQVSVEVWTNQVVTS